MNILQSHTSDKLLQFIFYSPKPERKEGTPYMQRRKISTGKNSSWNQSSEKMQKKGPHTKGRTGRYIEERRSVEE